MNTTELVTFSRPAVANTLAEVGLMLDETKMLLTRLQASMLCDQVVAYAAHHRVNAACGVLQSPKERRMRRLQTLFGTVEVETPRFKLCRCSPSALMVEARTVSPVCALLTARCWLGASGALLVAVLHNIGTLAVMANAGRLLRFQG